MNGREKKYTHKKETDRNVWNSKMTKKQQSSFSDIADTRWTLGYPHVEDDRNLYNIVVEWRHDDTIKKLNENMQWATEEFGECGKKWNVEISSDSMTLRFQHKHDALLARLKFGL
jgi:hypothetical protein